MEEETGGNIKPTNPHPDPIIHTIILRGYSFKHIKSLVSDPNMPVFLKQAIEEKEVMATIIITQSIKKYIIYHLEKEQNENFLWTVHNKSITKTLNLLYEI